MQHEGFVGLTHQGVDFLLILRSAESDHRQNLGLPTSEEAEPWVLGRIPTSQEMGRISESPLPSILFFFAMIMLLTSLRSISSKAILTIF